MRRIIVEMSRTNALIHADEVALVNVTRRLKRACPTGYGSATVEIEFAGHFMKFITTTLKEKTIVDTRGPSFIAEVIDVTQGEEEEVQAGGPQGRDGS